MKVTEVSSIVRGACGYSKTGKKPAIHSEMGEWRLRRINGASLEEKN